MESRCVFCTSPRPPWKELAPEIVLVALLENHLESFQSWAVSMRVLCAREAVDLSEIEARQIWTSIMDRGTDYPKFVGLY